MNKKVLVAVAWPYVNGDLHLGHLAGYLLPADIFARYQRLRGNDVLMVSGSDCHGTPITVEADKQKVGPEAIVARYHQQDMALFRQYGIRYNLYTKTTTENHKHVVHEIFLDLLRNGYIVKGTMKQYYSSEDKQFLPDRYVEGTCPYCQAKDQRSDQCENCGRWLGDGELIDPKSKLTGAAVILKDTEHYFLDFPQLSTQLQEYIDGKTDGHAKKEIWRSWVFAESQGWLKEGLQKRAITRDMDWSIELPISEIKKLSADKQLADYTGKRIYVWFEAVIGYLSAAVEWSATEKDHEDVIFNRDPGQSTDWKDWWFNKDAEIVNFMGQDNLVFHTLMWPAELMGTKRGYTLPDNVVVSKFMNYEGKKFSKSRNWTIDSKRMADKYGVDLIRYYMAANFPENKEANFTWEGFVGAINNELVANLGNFINRSLKFLETKFSGSVSDDKYILDDEVRHQLQHTFQKSAEHLGRAEMVEALNVIMEFSRFGNQYFDKHKIWEVMKEKPEEAKRIMLSLVNIIFNLATLIEPYLPAAATQIRAMMGQPELEIKVGSDSWNFHAIQSTKLSGPVTLLFTKLDKATVLAGRDA